MTLRLFLSFPFQFPGALFGLEMSIVFARFSQIADRRLDRFNTNWRVDWFAAKDNRFTPAAIQVPAGTTVTWRFEDGFVPHDVKADGFTSGDPRRKGTFTHTFDRPGTYPYRCTVHDGMTGRVVVTGS